MAILILVPSSVWAAAPQDGKIPLVIAFTCPLGDKPGPSEADVVMGVFEQMNNSGLVKVLVFNRDSKTLARAILEKKITQDVVNEVSNPQKAAQVAGALGADYALCVQGTTVESDISIFAQLLKAPAGENWMSASRGKIADSGPKPVNRDNAISTAASSAVSQVFIMAFGQESVMQAGISTPKNLVSSPLIPMTTDTPRDTAAEYADIIKRVDAYVAKKDLPNAIVELRRAINLQPDKAEPRVKLAGLYSDLGMTALAIDECRRVLLFNKGDASVYNMLAKMYIANGAMAEAALQCAEIVRLDPQNADARMNLGDVNWNQGKIDDAAKEYEEAAKLAPANPTPHEKLKILYQARKKYPQALEEALLAKKSAAGTISDDAAQYNIVAQVLRDEINTIMGKLSSSASEFSSEKISREDYYADARDAANRISALEGFLSKQPVAGSLKSAHAHAMLAVSLLAQAGGSVVSFLETEKQHYADEASLLQGEAGKELDQFSKILAKG